MLVFAFISELPFDMGFFSRFSILEGTFPFYFEYQNVFFTLFLGLMALYSTEKLSCNTQDKRQKIKSVFLQVACVGTICVFSDLIHCDYGSQGILFIVSFYILRKNRIYQTLMFLVLYMLLMGNQPSIYTMISALAIMFYNVKPGNMRLKYFFYAFYPIHILLLYLITVILGKVLFI